MENDDITNNGSYFVPREPIEQVLDRKKERAAALEARKELEKVIDHFNERIEFRDKLSSINIDITKDPALHQKICEVNDLLKLALIEEKGLIEDLLEIHSR